MNQKTYIKTILPLRLEWEPCYCVEPSLFEQTEVPKIGDRIRVKFARKEYIGVVSEVGVRPDVDESKILPIISTNTALEPISKAELKLWRFISEYYLCTIGEVYDAAYPSNKQESEQIKLRVEDRKKQKQEREIEQIKKRLETLRTRLQAKNKDLSGNHGDKVMQRLRDEKAKILEDIAEFEEKLGSYNKPLKMDDGISLALVNLPETAPDARLKSLLNPTKPLCLKQGYRANSYITIAADYIRRGKNVLILIPEIQRTKKFQNALSAAFRSILLQYHSQQTPAQRREVSEWVRGSRPYVLLGTRSSIFLNFNNLGLIIVDNEQSANYKQTDTAPRYNCRDCAVMLGRIHGADVILGSASPSIESIYNCKCGKYSYLDLSEPKGTLNIIDIPAERRKNGMAGEIFSKKLVKEMKDSRGEVALIRGYEKLDNIYNELKGIFPGETNRFATFPVPTALCKNLSKLSLLAILNADVLFNNEDFRSDERAFQYIEELRLKAPKITVQTSRAANQVFSLKTVEPLLKEREEFSLPPYTRLVDLHFRTDNLGGILSMLQSKLGLTCLVVDDYNIRVTLPRDTRLAANKAAILKCLSALKFRPVIDVDPV